MGNAPNQPDPLPTSQPLAHEPADLARRADEPALRPITAHPEAPRKLAGVALTNAFVALSLATIAYLFVQLLMFRYGRDQGIYATVADSMLRGGMPYRDAWDFKPPGIFIIYALCRAVFGSAQWAIRLFEVVGLGSVVVAFALLARRFFAEWRIGILGGALAVLVHAELEFWHTAQPESFGGMLTAWALWLSTYEPSAESHREKKKQLAGWVLSGMLYGFAFLLKPPLGGAALVSSAFVALRIRRNQAEKPGGARLLELATPAMAMAAGGMLVVAICAAWFVLRGAMGDLYETLFVFTPHYTKLSWEGVTIPGMLYLAWEEWFMDLSSPTAVGVSAALLLAPVTPREREGVLHVLGVVAVQLVGVALQGKFFPYHYGGSLVLGSLVAGLGAYKLWERALAKGAAGVALYAALLPAVLLARSATRNTQTDFFARCVARQRQLLGLSSATDEELDSKLYSVADVSYEANRLIAEFLRRRLAPDELVHIWGFEPVIYDMSERRPASRYIYNVPQRVAWSKERARAELLSDLAAHPPKAIVVEHRDVFPAVTGDAIDSADTLHWFPALAARIRDDYELEITIEDFDVYLRK